MVRDVEASFDELVAHDLIAAIAGDEEAKEALRANMPAPDSIPRRDFSTVARDHQAVATTSPLADRSPHCPRSHRCRHLGWRRPGTFGYRVEAREPGLRPRPGAD